MKGCDGTQQDDERCSGHAGNAFACQHQCEHHQKLLAETHLNARNLRDKDGSE